MHTPDERYTLPEIYDAVLDYATKHYNLEDKHIARPFIPGGDYQQYVYDKNDVVVDNPPFSITSKIVHCYLDHNVPFFLFINGQYGVSLSRSLVGKATVILTGIALKYHTGAPVQGGFVTNLDNKSVIINHDLYGGGYLVSKQAYNEYINKLNSYHDPKVKVIKLTDGEKEIVNNLTKKAGRRSEEINLF